MLSASTAVVEQLAQGPALASAARLCPIDRVKGLVQEQAGGPAVVDPRRAVAVEAGRVPQQRQEVGHDEAEARQRDEVGRHAGGEAVDHHARVEGLEDVLGRQTPVDRGVLVVPQVGQLLLANVDHRCCLGPPRLCVCVCMCLARAVAEEEGTQWAAGRRRRPADGRDGR